MLTSERYGIFSKTYRYARNPCTRYGEENKREIPDWLVSTKGLYWTERDFWNQIPNVLNRFENDFSKTNITAHQRSRGKIIKTAVEVSEKKKEKKRKRTNK